MSYWSWQCLHLSYLLKRLIEQEWKSITIITTVTQLNSRGRKKDKQDYSNFTQITNSHIDDLNFKTTKNLKAVSQGDYNSMKKNKNEN